MTFKICKNFQNFFSNFTRENFIKAIINRILNSRSTYFVNWTVLDGTQRWIFDPNISVWNFTFYSQSNFDPNDFGSKLIFDLNRFSNPVDFRSKISGRNITFSMTIDFWPKQFSNQMRFDLECFIWKIVLVWIFGKCKIFLNFKWYLSTFKIHILKYHFPRKINVFEHFRVKKYIFDLKNLKVFIIYVEHARVSICSTYKY